MGKIIACVNEKGGVAKTTTIKNLSVGLAQRNKKVLAIDLDPSANLTTAFGVNADAENGNISDIIRKTILCEDIPEEFGIVHQEEGIDIIPSIKGELRNCETELSQAFQREIVLRRYLSTVNEKYDYIMIDCPAGLGLFVTNALFCADYLIIPLQAHRLAVEAVQNLFQTVAMVRKLNGTFNLAKPKPAILGGLFTMVRTNTKNDVNIMEMLREQYKTVPFFNTFIPLAAKIPESDVASESIFKHAKNSSAALIYEDLVEEIVTLLEMEGE